MITSERLLQIIGGSREIMGTVTEIFELKY